MISMQRVQHALIEGVHLYNSPRYHMFLVDVDDFLIQNVEIKADIYAQKKLAIKYGFFNFKLNLPTFPLNTDGIDPAGSNIHIRNVNITSYDDSIAVKPARQDYTLAKCAENITAENLTTWMGVGMTIGTVPPNPRHYCVRNVTFRNVHFWYPFKAVYIKTNPGENGDGIIENILYENLTIVDPIWWAIYLGPQQQKQPDGRGPGCMLYPLNKDCETQPRVTIRNITLRNIEATGGVLPGIIRCNETNPCTNINFENVHYRGFMNWRGLDYGFITENVYGSVKNSYPNPHFKSGHPSNDTNGNSVQVFSTQNESLFKQAESIKQLYSQWIADKFAGVQEQQLTQ